MALINWNETYSVKIKEIDTQHKKLVDLINLLHDSMKGGKGREQVEPILTELVNYTAYHFSFEEKLFGQHNYPDTKIHIRQHNDLLEQVKIYIKSFQDGKGVLPIELMDFLQKWLLNHINGTDKKYSAFFNSKGIN
jgi:hemerythrin-like metal-binding protein